MSIEALTFAYLIFESCIFLLQLYYVISGLSKQSLKLLIFLLLTIHLLMDDFNHDVGKYFLDFTMFMTD